MPNWIRMPLTILFVVSILASLQEYIGAHLRIVLALIGVFSGALLIFDNAHRKRMKGIESVALTQEFPPDLHNIDIDVDL